MLRIGNYFKNQAKNISNMVSKDKPNYVISNTFDSKNIPEESVKQISQLMNFLAGEKIELLYSDNQQFLFDNNVIIGITNYRLFKFEKDNQFYIFRAEIAKIKHVENNVFSWDKIELVMKDYSIQTIGIWHPETCKYFIDYLNTNKPADIPDIKPNREIIVDLINKK